MSERRFFSIGTMLWALFVSFSLLVQTSAWAARTPLIDPAGRQVATVMTAMATGAIDLQLVGDGVSTDVVKVLITNKSNRPLKLVMERGQTFVPDNPSFQTMMMRQDLILNMDAGQKVVQTDLPSLCVSEKSVPPPPSGEKGVKYKALNYGNVETWKQLIAIMAAANDLEKRGMFGNVPFAANKKEKILQMAIWKLLGDKSMKDIDKVTPESIQQSLLDEVGNLIQKNPSALAQLGDGYKMSSSGKLTVVGKKQKESLDERVDKIFSAVDITVQRSTDPNLPDAAGLPLTDFDTFCNVGERAFQRGEYSEAEEILKAAADEAYKFGEADPRYSRSLSCLGRVYLELAWTDKAESFLGQALDLRQRTLGNAPEVAHSNNDMGQLRQLQNSYGKADAFFSKALEVLKANPKSSPLDMAKTLNNYGRNANLLKDTVRSVPALRQALMISMDYNEKLVPQVGAKGATPSAVAPNQLPSETAEVAEIETNLATSYLNDGKLDEAKNWYEKALAVDQKALPENHPYIATILDGLAETLSRQDKRQDAEVWKKKADDIRQKSFGQDNIDLAKLPFGYDSFTRMQAFLANKGLHNVTVEEFRGKSTMVPGASLDKAEVNRPIADKWALVIGISKFKDNELNLQYPAKDARDFAKFLVEKENFKSDHVKLLVDEQATRENIMYALGQGFLPHAANPDDLVVIFISSHGSPSDVDQKGANFLLAHNSSKDNLYGTGIPMSQLVASIKDRCNCKRVVIFLDACHSGAVAESEAMKGIFRVGNFDAAGIAQGAGQLVVCSSMPSETSWESKRYPNGVFTRCLIEALSQGGTGTKMKDAFTILQDKVQQEVIHDRGVGQRPNMKMKWDGEDLVIGAPPTVVRPAPNDPEVKEAQATTTGGGGDAKGLTGATTAKPKVPTGAPTKAKSPLPTTGKTAH